MKSAFGETLVTLAGRRKAYQEQIIAIQQFERLLENLTVEPTVGVSNLPDWAKFEVHFQCYAPEHHAVSVVGRSLSKAYERAVALWKEHNGEHSNHGSACTFISDGNMLLAISPVDSAWIASNEKCDTFHPDLFKYDDRLLEKVGKTVWLLAEQLPGWHSSEPVVLEDEPKN